MILLLILAIVIFSAIVRLLTIPFRYGRRHRRMFYGNGYGYNPYNYGCRRHHRFLGSILPIVALVALDRLIGRRF